MNANVPEFKPSWMKASEDDSPSTPGRSHSEPARVFRIELQIRPKCHLDIKYCMMHNTNDSECPKIL